MLLQLLAALIFLGACLGWGRLFFGIKTKSSTLNTGFEEHIVFGFAVLLTLGYLTHFFFALRGWVVQLPILAGMGLLIYSSIQNLWKNRFKGWQVKLSFARILKFLGFVLILVLSILFVAKSLLRSSYVIGEYDSLLYHIPATKWMMEQPFIPGLSHLQFRFGFFSGAGILTAYSSWMLPTNASFTSVHIMFLLLFLFLFVRSVWKILFADYDLADQFLCCAVPVFLLGGYAQNFSLAPELPLFVLLSVSFYLALKKKVSAAWIAWTIACVIKISALPFLLPLILISYKNPTKIRHSIHWRVLMLGLVLWIVFMVRNGLTGGELLPPIQQTRVALFAQYLPIKLEQTNMMRDVIYDWARHRLGGGNTSEWNFFSQFFFPSIPYFLRMLFVWSVILSVSQIPYLLVVKELNLKWESLLFSGLLGVVVLQYLSAPDYRLMWPSVLVLFSSLGCVIWSMSKHFWNKATGITQGFFILISMLAFTYQIQGNEVISKSLLLKPFAAVHNVTASYQQDFRIPFQFTVPEIKVDDRCGVAPLPCLLSADDFVASQAKVRFDSSGNIKAFYREK